MDRTPEGTSGTSILDLPHYPITPLTGLDTVVEVVGSKSYTNRFLAIAGLCAQPTTLHNALHSQDTILLAEALRRLGHVDVELRPDVPSITVSPNGRPMRAPAQEIDMGNAGTPIRFLITMAALADGRTVLTGNQRMRERPMGHLLEALRALGVRARALHGNDSPPIEVWGPAWRGGGTHISGTVSSQFTSSLLVCAPVAEQGLELHIDGDLVSGPYVDMTIAAMRQAGIGEISVNGYSSFAVPAGQQYLGGDITVEPDASAMSYFVAAAAILGGKVTIPGIGPDSRQGDVGLIKALTDMGCTCVAGADGITVEGDALRGIDIDMTRMPDVVPTLAVVAAYAKGRTHITGIGNLRFKECDRIAAVATELGKMGVRVDTTIDTMTIHGGAEPKGAWIHTYDDHRIAMAFAIAGLRTPGVVIEEPACVTKSFPSFWERFEGLRGGR
ncbi:3-phosphoshikimate 1-carboxyvinyltransferase [Spongiactinospora gelatinilytica]|uniref:3-phosphoshikimate 1-carboxyvinyltransferase n=1 Tax=Spongiactinospora gelatinilytica TaxID=2666298 RepID=A0A2W2J4U9_9ACTN|nr:3-phosphoshikimate 1-carboxyvinyltransferase [Spongiactinospora gelatinilytica]PZG56664.1 3-phosphoshikimate 1-carboxyvinyltransferase [Spongiactinospora gelatinilytica]